MSRSSSTDKPPEPGLPPSRATQTCYHSHSITQHDGAVMTSTQVTYTATPNSMLGIIAITQCDTHIHTSMGTSGLNNSNIRTLHVNSNTSRGWYGGKLGLHACLQNTPLAHAKPCFG